MILLIPLLGTSVEELKENLNSIMILLILESLNQYGERKQKFKFHYDSINSACNGDWNAYQGHLNSIMILLIRLNLLNMERKIVHLNSIMILLIHKLHIKFTIITD